jgi:hypothetical protein
MADTAARLYGPTALGTSAATIYTSAASTVTIIRHIIVVNTTLAVVRVTISVGADAAGTRILYVYPIGANQNYEWKGFLVLAAAELIQAYADTASAATMTMNGVKVT